MLNKLTNIKQEALDSLKPLEEEINEAAKSTTWSMEVKEHLSEEKQLEGSNSPIYNETINKLTELNNTLIKEEFKNNLAEAIFTLERHEGSIKDTISKLEELGKGNKLIQDIAKSLNGLNLNSDKEILKEFKRSVNRARLSVLIRRNESIQKYMVGLIAYYLFGKYKFKKAFKDYLEFNNTELVDDLRHLSYLEEYLKEQNYSAALSELEQLGVTLSEYQIEICYRRIERGKTNVGEESKNRARNKNTKSI